MNDPQQGELPRISVVVASKVGAPFIDYCLSSLQAQAGRAEVFVLVGRRLSHMILAPVVPFMTRNDCSAMSAERVGYIAGVRRA